MAEAPGGTGTASFLAARVANSIQPYQSTNYLRSRTKAMRLIFGGFVDAEDPPHRYAVPPGANTVTE